MNRLTHCILYLALAAGLIGAGNVSAQEVWSDAGGDANWSTDGNWLDGTAPANPYTGTVWFGDAGRYTTSLLDQDWTVRYLQYTNVAGFFQCFDDLAFPATADYATRTNRDWVAHQCRIFTGGGMGGYAQLTNEIGFLRTPACETGIGMLSLKYHNSKDTTAPAGRFEIQVSPDGEAWSTVATIISKLSKDWFLFETNLNDSVNTYVRILNPSPDAKIDVGNVDVRFRVPARQPIDLNGNRLIVSNGHLQVGDTGSRNGQINHTKATLFNGTLQIGTTNAASDLLIGHMTAGLITNGERRGSELSHQGVLDSCNLRNLYVGYGAYSPAAYIRQSVEGGLDLSLATLVSGARTDTLVADKLYVGVGYGTAFGRGWLALPSSLKTIEVGEFQIGCDGTSAATGWSTGRVDFGESSQLEQLTVSRFLNLGSGAYCVLDGLPDTVNVTVGKPGQPGDVWVGAGSARWASNVNGFGARLCVSNASFGGHLDELYVGVGMDYTEGNAITGLLDLAHADIVTDGVTNSLSCPAIRIGGSTVLPSASLHPSRANGVLKLPASLTNIACSVFQVGANNTGIGVVDLGRNSQLKRFFVAEEFIFARCGGRAYLPDLPAGLEFQVGLPDAPAAIMTVASHTSSIGGLNTPPGQGDLCVTGGVFSAYIDTLEVGKSYYVDKGNFTLCGRLILSNATLRAFDVTHDVTIGRGMPEATYKNVWGELHLPPGTMNIGGNLYLGYQERGADASRGLLDLNGTTVRISGGLDMWDTGRVQTHLKGSSAGIDLLASVNSALSVSNNATINLVFEQDSIDPKEHYWGLRWAGEHVTTLQDLCASDTISWVTDTLSPKQAALVGVWYDARKDYTFVGIPKPFATVFIIR